MQLLRTIPIHRFGVRHNLFLGGDRELVMFAGLLAFAMIFSAVQIKATVFGLCFWLLCLFLCRLMAKADPLLRHVYLRHRRYKSFYPAHSSAFCQSNRDYK